MLVCERHNEKHVSFLMLLSVRQRLIARGFLCAPVWGKLYHSHVIIMSERSVDCFVAEAGIVSNLNQVDCCLTVQASYSQSADFALHIVVWHFLLLGISLVGVDTIWISLQQMTDKWSPPPKHNLKPLYSWVDKACGCWLDVFESETRLMCFHPNVVERKTKTKCKSMQLLTKWSCVNCRK